MRIFLLAVMVVAGSVEAQAQSQMRPQMQVASARHHGGAQCQNLAASLSQMASAGFRALNARQSCAASDMLQKTYRAFDSGRMTCGRGWAQSQAGLEMDVLDALDHAGETCGTR